MVKSMVVLFLAFSGLCVSDACRCAEGSDEQRSLRAYCNSDWIAEVTVTDVKPIDNTYYEYSINYTAVYKMPLRYKDNYPTEIYSQQRPEYCGMYKLPVDWEYFLVGYESSFQSPVYKIGITTCSYMNWDIQQKVKNNSTIDCSKIDWSFYGAKPAYNYGRNLWNFSP